MRRKPPLTSTQHLLAFDRLSAEDFERLCLWLVEEEEGWDGVEHLGAAGADGGCDLVAWRDGERTVFQCKREARFGPAKARAAVERVLENAAGEHPGEIVLVVPGNLSRQARQAARQAAGDQIRCRFWAGTELDRRVKQHPRVLAEFFGVPSPAQPEPAPVFGDEDSEALARQLQAAIRRKEQLVCDHADRDALHAVQEEILHLRRLIREGARLTAGDYLAGERFRLLERIGKGNFATVWRAYDRHEEELVAIKVLHGQHAEDRSRRERFFRGARRMGKLRHRGIVRVIGQFPSDAGFHHFVMELVGGGDLERAVRAGRVAPAAAMSLVLELADALQYAHEQGVVHRDVTPANVLLDLEQRPKLTDFDLVRALDSTGGTGTRASLGRFLFAAPEAMTNAAEAGVPADVYSLGVTAIFALHGGDLPHRMFGRIGELLEQMPISPLVRGVLAKAVEWEPEDRWQSVREFKEALLKAQQGQRPAGRGSAREAGSGARQERSPRADELSEANLDEVLAATEEPGERSRIYLRLPELVDDPDRLLALVARLAQRTSNGYDLFFLDLAAREAGVRWPARQSRARETRRSLYDHLAEPPEALFRWVETCDGRVELWREIPEGSFLMGSPEKESPYRDERPRHEVTIRSAFALAAVPMTNAQYAVFDPGHRPTAWRGVDEASLAHHPVESVTWYEAVSFCRWLAARAPWARGARLPTEEEWEHACRAGTQTAYWKGDTEEHLAAVGWYGGNSGRRTHRVGEKPANDWGLYDVHGNVWEWTFSPRTGSYEGREAGVDHDPTAVEADFDAEASGDGLVLRGGSYWGDAVGCRAACRFRWDPRDRVDDRGFRVLLPVPPSDGK